MNYQFTRRTTDLPDGIERTKTFEADSFIESLQMASDYWFNQQKVADWQGDKNGVITLLSASQSGNVIGTLMH